jgi:hypothetical protein
MSNEIFLHNKEREIIKELKQAKKSYYDYYPNSLFENIPELTKNDKYISSYETISKINGSDLNNSFFSESQLKNEIENTNLFLPNLPREPTDFVSILSFPYTNKNTHSLNTSSNNIQSFSNNLKKKKLNLDDNDNNSLYKHRDEQDDTNSLQFLDPNFHIWNQLSEKKSFLTSKSNNWDLKDKDKKIYSYDNGIPFQSPYLSEVNLDIYEEIYQMYYNHQFSYGQYNKVIEEKELIKNLLNMIVGISSTYFTYNSSKEKFEIKDIRIQYLRIVGCDGQSLSRYMQTYLDMGTNFKRLEKLTKIYQSNSEIYGLIDFVHATLLMNLRN